MRMVMMCIITFKDDVEKELHYVLDTQDLMDIDKEDLDLSQEVFMIYQN